MSQSDNDVDRKAGEAARAAAAELRRARSAIAEAAVGREFRERPDLWGRYGQAGRDRCLEDAGRHLDYLSTAVAKRSQSLFDDYIQWAAILLGRLDIPEDDLRRNVLVIRDQIEEQLSAESAAAPLRIINAALAQLGSNPNDPGSFLAEGPHSSLARDYLGALLEQDRAAATALILDAVDNGVHVRDIYLHVFQRVQYEVGRLWQTGKIGVAEEHYCTAATQVIMARLYPHVFSARPNGRRMVAACVGGDLHEIGLRMLADFFEMEGWDTAFIGASTPSSSLIKTLVANPPDLLAVSATMTFNVSTVAELIQAVRREAPGVRILVGGYPFHVETELWRRIDADGTAIDAQQALELARTLFEDAANVN